MSNWKCQKEKKENYNYKYKISQVKINKKLLSNCQIDILNLQIKIIVTISILNKHEKL